MMRAAITLASLLVFLASEPARAQIPPMLRSGTHPMWASMSMGPAINVKDSATQFKLIQTFGYHFQGNAAGPALAFDLQEAFGNGFTTIELGPKFVWDFPIVQSLGLYLSPSAMLGYAWAGTGGSCYTYYGQEFCTGGGGGSAFDMQFGFEGKLIIGDRGLVFFRPFTLDVGIFDGVTMIRYDLMFGGGVTF